MFYLSDPPSISKSDSPPNEATKKPGRTVLDRVSIPYCLDVFTSKPSGKAHDFEETGYAA